MYNGRPAAIMQVLDGAGDLHHNLDACRPIQDAPPSAGQVVLQNELAIAVCFYQSEFLREPSEIFFKPGREHSL